MNRLEPLQLAQLFQKPAANAATLARAVQPGAAQKAPAAGFADALKGALDAVSRSQAQASDLARRFQENDPAVSLEQTMIASAKASVSFQALVQTRNRLVQAYQDIMNMPV